MGEHFEALVQWLSVYGYPVLFLVVFAENAGVPVPGETVVLISGVLAGRAEAPMSIFGVIGVTFLAAVLGDNLGFWLGRRWARPRLQQGKRFLFLTPRALRSVEGYFEHYGLLTIFFARFVTGLRVVAALAAGTSSMVWPSFLAANALGALAWAVTISLLGYFFGQSWELLHKLLGRGALLILVCVVILVALPILWRRLRQLPARSWDHLLRFQLWQGALAALLVVLCLHVLLILVERHVKPMGEDTTVSQWIAAHRVPWAHAPATLGSYLGSLPVLIVLCLLALGWQWHAGRPWREAAVVAWALLASEAVGLFLLGLLRHRGIEPPRALAWPFGFAGLQPMRAAAVYGMLAYLITQPRPRTRRLAVLVTVCLVLLVGVGGIWSAAQTLSEVLVEYVAGSLVLFLGLWWLEGYGLGPFSPGPGMDNEPRANGSERERVSQTGS